jgi:Fe-S-cluster-containing dehydrogenase component
MKQMAIVTDLDRCTGCHACTVACAQENHLRPGSFWNRVYEVGPAGRFPDLQMYFIPVACQHCAEPACVKACPTGASYKRADGIVLIDHNKCIGCRACEKACPYKVHYFAAEGAKSEKCTLCTPLVDADDKPACVKTCTARARHFGDLGAMDDAVAKLAFGSGAHRLLPEAGTRPSARYLLRRQDWKGISAAREELARAK